MRVIAGSARGKNLAALPGEEVTRPTINRVKDAPAYHPGEALAIEED